MRHFTLFFCLLLPALLWARVEKLRCMWRSNPATSMVIGWHQASGTQPVLHYATYDAGNDPTAYPFSAKPDRTKWAKGMHNHFVRLEDLEPNTLYFFIISDSDGVSRQLKFQTAPDNRYERLSIVAGGDSRNYRDARRRANEMVSKLQPHCVFFAGDMTGGDSDREWKEWLNDWQATITPEGRLIPIITARGNHESSNETLVDMFDVPHDKVYYAMTLGGDLLRIYTLNSMYSSSGAQKEWLRADLQDHTHVRWRAAQYHHAIRPHTQRKRERKDLQKHWSSLFFDYQVQLAIECDAHVVKNTYPIRPGRGTRSQEGFIRDDNRGTVYVGEGCWGAPLRRANDPKSWTRSLGSFNQFKWIWVNADEMEIRTVKTDSAPNTDPLSDCDRFSIPKGIDLWNPDSGTVIRIPESPLYASTSTVYEPSKVGYQESKASASPKTLPVNHSTKPIQKEKAHQASTSVKSVRVKPQMEVNQFKANIQDGQVHLNWKTSHEPKQSIFFELYRSDDSQSFQKIAAIETVGLSTNEYQIKDGYSESLKSGQYIYRLVHQNPKGERKILETKAEIIHTIDVSAFKPLTWDKKAKLTRINYRLAEAGQVSIRIQDQTGKTIQKTEYTHRRPGNYLRSLHLKALPLGYYLVTVSIEGAEDLQYQLHKSTK